MKVHVIQYRCRLCGEVFDGARGDQPNVATAIFMAMSQGSCGLFGIPVERNPVHSRCKKGYGVADLIGAVEKEL